MENMNIYFSIVEFAEFAEGKLVFQIKRKPLSLHDKLCSPEIIHNVCRRTLV